MNTEIKSKEWQKWEEAKSLIGDMTFTLGPYTTYQLMNTPRRLLFALSRYKFCAKIIGAGQDILEIGCNEGLSTYILAEHARFYYGIDIDEKAIERAQTTIKKSGWKFAIHDIMQSPTDWRYSGAVSMDVIEHIYPENSGKFLANIAASLTRNGMCIIGTPNIEHDKYASPMSKIGHVNLYSHDRLKQQMSQYFERVIMHSSNDEMVHTGFEPTANYILGVGICPRQTS
jgi:2-polyprenyl-3-methyl-5-hydroxy-6-metoxy-1,4-benzoquinol methylase